MTEIVEFFEVRQRALGGTWTIVDRLASSDLPVVAGVDTFRSVAWQRGGLESSQEVEREDIRLGLPASDALAVLFLPAFPEHPIRITIKRATSITRGVDSVAADTYSTIYVGDVVGARFSRSQCELTLQSPERLLEEQGPRQRYQRSCRWDLYGPGCGVDSAALEVATTATVGADPAPYNYTDYVFADGFGGGGLVDGYFAGGTLTLAGQYVRQIAAHVATAPATAPFKPYVRLVTPFPVAVADGDALVALPGCRHTETDCLTKFSNVDNFGGFARVARDNPFRKTIEGGVE